jgi:Porin subfamily
MTGAQAADLPVKAKPVQYVKICSLYGAGFYYIPGTDMCLKMGGWARAEYSYGFGNGTLTWGPYSGNVNNRTTSNSVLRARAYITADARNQTEYGTIRSYIAVGINTNDVGLNTPANQFSANRAFLQMAGFTFGISQSFFDFYSAPATALYGGYPASDTGDPGWLVMGYTAQFGNGLSATISAEERRTTQINNTGLAAGVAANGTLAPGGYTTAVAGITANAGAYGGFQMPDVVANLRADQAWGSAQIMGAVHQVNANYYGALPSSGHPSDAYGWAVGAGIKLLAPMIAPGDYFQAQVNYTEGALRYVFFTPNTNWGKVDGNSEAYGVMSDAVYGSNVAATGAGGTGLELTTSWGVNAAYEHFWNKQWKTSAYGGYAAVSYNSTANNMLCAQEVAGVGVVNAVAQALGPVWAALGCDNNWSTYWIGSRTQWNIDSSTYLAVDVLYQRMQSAQGYLGVLPGAVAIGGAAAPIIGTVADQDNVAVRFRVHRDFYP